MKVDLSIGRGYGKVIKHYFEQIGLKLEDDNNLYSAYGVVRGEVEGFEYDFLTLRLRVFCRLHREVKDIDGQNMITKWGPVVEWSMLTPEQAETLIPLNFEISREWMTNAEIH
jgi:hypothetical protein